MTERKHLSVVSEQPTKPRRTYAGEPLQCSCGSREFTETKIGLTVRDGKVSGGQKQFRCYHCGKVVWP